MAYEHAAKLLADIGENYLNAVKGITLEQRRRQEYDDAIARRQSEREQDRRWHEEDRVNARKDADEADALRRKRDIEDIKKRTAANIDALYSMTDANLRAQAISHGMPKEQALAASPDELRNFERERSKLTLIENGVDKAEAEALVQSTVLQSQSISDAKAAAEVVDFAQKAPALQGQFESAKALYGNITEGGARSIAVVDTLVKTADSKVNAIIDRYNKAKETNPVLAAKDLEAAFYGKTSMTGGMGTALPDVGKGVDSKAKKPFDPGRAIEFMRSSSATWAMSSGNLSEAEVRQASMVDSKAMQSDIMGDSKRIEAQGMLLANTLKSIPGMDITKTWDEQPIVQEIRRKAERVRETNPEIFKVNNLDSIFPKAVAATPVVAPATVAPQSTSGQPAPAQPAPTSSGYWGHPAEEEYAAEGSTEQPPASTTPKVEAPVSFADPMLSQASQSVKSAQQFVADSAQATAASEAAKEAARQQELKAQMDEDAKAKAALRYFQIQAELDKLPEAKQALIGRATGSNLSYSDYIGANRIGGRSVAPVSQADVVALKQKEDALRSEEAKIIQYFGGDPRLNQFKASVESQLQAAGVQPSSPYFGTARLQAAEGMLRSAKAPIKPSPAMSYLGRYN